MQAAVMQATVREVLGELGVIVTDESYLAMIKLAALKIGMR
jgi:hypothetical protein